jgi:hypothetical protein
MKTLIAIILVLILVLIMVEASAQKLFLQTGVEKTVAGYEYVGSLSYETKRMWALGSFYQTGLTRNNPEGILAPKNNFYVMLMQAPIAKSERLAFLVNLRAGFVNEKFLVIVPSVETRVHISSRIGVTVGTGLRMGYPSLSVKTFIKLF